MKPVFYVSYSETVERDDLFFNLTIITAEIPCENHE